MGRDLLPGENDAYGGLRSGQQYHNRLVRAQLSSPDSEQGIVRANTIEVLGTRTVTVPPLWFSGTGRKSCWGRYMPQGGEIVNIAYRNDDSAVIAGYDMTATKDGSAGWSELRRFQKEGVVGYANFQALKPGEFDFKSSGDAYIFGSQGGTLLLAGGQAFIKLNKKDYRIESKASEFHYTSETSEIRFGTVFRKKLPTDFAEAAINPLYKEFLLDINQAVAGFPSPQSKIKIHLGDILTEPVIGTGVLKPGPYGVPLRAKISMGDKTNTTEVFGLQIDQLGNIKWEQNLTGVNGLEVSANKLAFNSNTTTTIESVVQNDFNAPIINLGGTLVNLGGSSAVHALILGTPYRTAEATMNGTLVASFTAAAAGLTAAAADPLMVPFVQAVAGLTAAAAAMTACAAAVQTFETAGAPLASYLSVVSKTV